MILLYQRPQDGHQTPEILVYSQRCTSQLAWYVGSIAFSEDDRTQVMIEQHQYNYNIYGGRQQ